MEESFLCLDLIGRYFYKFGKLGEKSSQKLIQEPLLLDFNRKLVWKITTKVRIIDVKVRIIDFDQKFV